jgi:multicomponent Na+:H+ antiporter subunit F
MMIATLSALMVAIVLYLARAVAGPTVYDRVLALNAMGTKTVLLVVVLGLIGGRTDYLDIALAYALINFTATLAMLKLIHLRKGG